jgi:hypothetical protein
MALARKFNLAFPYVKPLHIDDTYLGIVARKLGIRPTLNQQIGYRKMQPDTLQRLIIKFLRINYVFRFRS